MVDFSKLRSQSLRPAPVDPLEIFRRLPKPQGINDLYTSQAEVLEAWFKRKDERDTVVKLHTGGGKTLVGLLIAQSTLNELKEPVLYLAPTTQLVKQTLEKAQSLGIAAVPYVRGQPLADDFVNGKAVMVASYKALFNGFSKFGVRGGKMPVKAGAVILDDAHVAFSVVRESFTLEISSKDDKDKYDALCTLFRVAFKEIDRLGTFDDTVSGRSNVVVEVPYWAWHEQIDTVRGILRNDGGDTPYAWPLLRDNLHLCHALISSNAFTVTTVLPLVNSFPTFADAPRRIYMSATIADDSEIVRTFDADPRHVNGALTSRSLAGISERMILIPSLMKFDFNAHQVTKDLLKQVAAHNLGAVVLVHSNHAAKSWEDVAVFSEGSEQVEKKIEALQSRKTNGPVVFANRYDGIDLPGDSCRLLVMEGLPAGTSDYELLRAATLYGGATISRMLAQRIEQGIGRGARGAGDHCVVLLLGSDLAGWIAKDANFKLLTSATRAQLEMGSTVSKEVKDVTDLANTIELSISRNADWVEYHAATLAENVIQDAPDPRRFDLAAAERKAFNNWADGYHDRAIVKLDQMANAQEAPDEQTRGWLLQLAGRIANNWGQSERSDELQRSAFAANRNLLRPRINPPYRPLPIPGAQGAAIAAQLRGYRIRRGLLQRFEQVVSKLNANASANQFEQALAELGELIGVSTERHDDGGEGPDVLWLLPTKTALILEVKSRKLDKNALTKDEHGQLLVAQQWFDKNYDGYTSVRVVVHPTNKATAAAVAHGSYALTLDSLTALVADARVLLKDLCESQLTDIELEGHCQQLIERSPIRADKLTGYLVAFVEG
ncbi:MULTISPECIES: DEAD/DEAH box helicase [unclassified Pseudomonas]|uniref:DEAD/DEAH box helicase n=1 Tax=unclassified Pseudomonas TaxID=196821 RepID=UPI0002A1B093|nr:MULTISPECIES: DEAD/DEAH box helicase [unclassified Pseudomonas]MBB1607505.1 helicase [Pseudomonas sp. UMC76]MBB1637463.1 helicase [Pseudomonas sp. UME83]NTX87962.1 DEAD/DEAH box helicase [Pseudomonas sp. UMA643]NTY17012.1 DEAD/DEAH box helicase [Pseudomonas sp. UMC3103]NTY22885.1 DEAD/DEAH box helicase [Pseudomonas sp. UMA603]